MVSVWQTFCFNTREMVALHDNEILSELKKFGIASKSERTFYLKEYKKYCLLQNDHIDSQLFHKRITRAKHTRR